MLVQKWWKSRNLDYKAVVRVWKEEDEVHGTFFCGVCEKHINLHFQLGLYWNKANFNSHLDTHSKPSARRLSGLTKPSKPPKTIIQIPFIKEHYRSLEMKCYPPASKRQINDTDAPGMMKVDLAGAYETTEKKT